MNPLRLAVLDASPFCYAKRGGMRPAWQDDHEGYPYGIHSQNERGRRAPFIPGSSPGQALRTFSPPGGEIFSRLSVRGLVVGG